MAYVPPEAGRWKCERCTRTSAVVNGWIRVEVSEDDGQKTRSLDFCPLCKLQVEKALRGLAVNAVREGRYL